MLLKKRYDYRGMSLCIHMTRRINNNNKKKKKTKINCEKSNDKLK